jgi:Right handed beta helix region
MLHFVFILQDSGKSVLENKDSSQEIEMKAFVMLAVLCGVAVAQSSTQTFDVRSYASLQEALNAASAAGGGTVQPQPDTTYTGPITLPANVTLRCADRSTVLTIPNAKNGAVLSIGGSNTAILNCTLDGNAANQKGGSGAIVNSADASNVLIDNAEIRNTYGAGVFLGATSAALGNVRVMNSYIHDTALMGIHVGGSRGLRIQHNRIKAFAVRTTKNDGLELTPSGSRTIFNTDVVISGNEIINTVSTFFVIESASGTYSQVVDGCSISDNVWDGGGLPASGISGFFFNCSMTGTLT